MIYAVAFWSFVAGAGLWAALVQRQFRVTDEQVRDLRHLCNAYRAELGEPPLFSSEHCDICTPSYGRSEP